VKQVVFVDGEELSVELDTEITLELKKKVILENFLYLKI
jgi:hypothetical protein